ncbi:MAG: hypothetical protein AAF708_09745 [Deinococcota bacterium]
MHLASVLLSAAEYLPVLTQHDRKFLSGLPDEFSLPPFALVDMPLANLLAG